MAEPASPGGALRRIALVGTPNVGKTSLFNHLTKLHQKVANYPGVTVEGREGRLHGSSDVQILDLPGVNSLVARSPDERVTADVLLGTWPETPRPDGVVVVVDSGRPLRGFFLLGQVLELGIPTVVCLNMVDEARRDGVSLDRDAVSREFGLPVVDTVATRREGIQSLVDAIQGGNLAHPQDDGLVDVPGIQGLPAASPERWQRLREVVEQSDLDDQEVAARYRHAQAVVSGSQSEPASTGDARKRRDMADGLLLHPLLGPVVFLLVMGATFQAVFALADLPIQWIESAFGNLGGGVRAALPEGLFSEFLVDGVIAGVGGVVVFLPQILILFLFIGLLEDSGYMTRAAFLVDRPLRAVGLSGRSFIPLLSSFACAIPGIMAIRGIEDRRERMITTMVAPLMTCSARLPVYTILIGAFVPDETVMGFLGVQGLVLLGLYLFGMFVAALAALVISRFLERAGQVPAIFELSPYRIPALRSVTIRLWQRASQFLKRAGTVICVMSVLVWAMMTFPRSDRPDGMDDATWAAQSQAESVAGRIGHAIEPVIEPLGYDWRIGIGLLGSLAAREVFVSTMSVVYAVEATDDEEETESHLAGAMGRARWGRTDRPVYTLATVLSLLVFYAIALQCLSTVAVVYSETRSVAWTAGQFLGLLALAWIGAFVTYQLAA